MIDATDANSEIKETDIIFDCPECGKSLAIDYRGAGLTIKCSDCGSDVQVPIPEGMEIEDLDSTIEDQEIRIIQLRRSLVLAQDRISALEEEVEDLSRRRDRLERDRSGMTLRYGEILEKTKVLEVSLKEAVAALNSIVTICAQENENRQEASDVEDDDAS